MLTKEEVKKVALLARIELSDEEVEVLQSGVSAVLEYVKELQGLNTEGLDEVSQVTGLVNVQRMDESKLGNNREEILAQAPEVKDEFYKVREIL
jgi:aspartyl-tRNA(Asn)/glutamyl-tRNA(Gln) amidotransferase subunit C